MATEKDYELTKYLVPRMFYFFIEPESCSAEVCCDPDTGMGCTADPDKKKAHVEVAIYRVNEEQTATDGEPRILRTWNKYENKAFRAVISREDNGDILLNNKKELEFKRDKEKEFPVEGIEYKELPVLVLFNEWLEPDREFVAYARIHNGAGWGPWHRVAQTRLDFIDEKGNTIRDLPMSESWPMISARELKRVVHEDSVNVDLRLDYLVIEDYIPIKSIHINNKDYTRFFKKKETKDKKYKYELSVAKKYALYGAAKKNTYHPLEIEIVAENALGYRSKAKKIFIPGKWKKQKATLWASKAPQGFGNKVTPSVHKFRIQYIATPYLCDFIGEYYDNSKIQLKCNYNFGYHGGFVRLRKASEYGEIWRSPFVGPMKIADPTEIIPVAEYEKVSDETNVSTCAATVAMHQNAWVWISDPLIVMHSAGLRFWKDSEEHFLPGNMGARANAYITINPKKKYYAPHTYQETRKAGIGTIAEEDDFSYITSPNAVIAGILYKTKDGKGVYADYGGILYDNEMVRVAVYTNDAEPAVRIENGVKLNKAGNPLTNESPIGNIIIKEDAIRDGKHNRIHINIKNISWKGINDKSYKSEEAVRVKNNNTSDQAGYYYLSRRPLHLHMPID